MGIERQMAQLLQVVRLAEAGGHVDGEEVCEAYSELLEACSDHPHALPKVRAIGAKIQALQARGVLPRTFVRRSADGPRPHRSNDRRDPTGD